MLGVACAGGAQDVTPDPVDWTDFSNQSTSQRITGTTDDIRITLQAPEDAQVEGDPFLLRRAVSNLLDNATDFSAEGAEVRMTLERTPRAVRIRVRDQGPGIPEYAQDKVFEKFYSLARPHSSKKSTGLGLSFVREIASLHHGRIELDNAPGGGALATLSLPLGDG